MALQGIPEHFKVFDVQHNPAADTEPDETQNRSAKNPLTADQLRQYWTVIRSKDNFKGAVLRLHLLTGGQRIEQLVRLHTDNSDEAQIWSTKSKWIELLLERRHYNVVVVALANKIARTAWAVLTRGATFDQAKWNPAECGA